MVALVERFGKYHVLERLARGGMAEVYKVKTVGIAGFEKIQALKRILPEYAREPRFIRSFVDEARIAVELNHRNIVQVFDFGKAAGELFLAMELIEGIDLRTAISDAARKRVELPVALACYILSEIGAGLDYAHRKTDHQGRNLGIVHCDVSPQNIMMSLEGYVKILDFGVARARFGTSRIGKRLRGKPRYMAPEQTRGEAPTPATDVFALAIIAWELLTGLPLFDGRDLASILEAVRRADAPAVDKLNPDVPAELSDAIARALTPQPENRGTSADIAAVLGRTAREIGGGGPRGLSAWLATLYPPPPPTAVPEPIEEPETTGPTSVEIPRAPEPVRQRAATPLPVQLENTANTVAGHVPDTRADDIDSDAKRPVALLEKRRVVACAVLVDGGSEPLRQQLTRMLGDLAYKRGAVVHSEHADGVVALFGLEVAGEDDVANAMSYALDTVEAAREAARLVEGDMAVRIGARAGITAQRRASGGYRLVGDSVQDAIDLARGAQPNRPLLAGGTGRLTSAYYAFRELPARRHLGARRRLRVLELLGPRSFDERDRALLERHGRFFGRQRQLSQLWHAFESANDEHRRVTVALVGEPGVGKSRLVAEFVARATATTVEPMMVAVAAAPSGKVAPFTLITELFQSALNLPPGRGEGARSRLTQRLRRVMDQAEVRADDVDDLVGAVEYAMELRDGALTSSPQPSTDLRDRLTAGLRSFRAVTMASQRPLVTVIEDLHYCDRASADVLHATVTEPTGGAELLVLTTRPEGLDSVPDAVAEVIELLELGGKDLRELIVDRLGTAASAGAIAAVVARAGGNPLFVEELASAVRESGSTEIPSSARDVIIARVDQLPHAAKAALQHAAVLGPTFRARIVEELLGPDVHTQLELLCEEGLLDRPDRASPEAREGELTFTRGLTREVVYENLSTAARRQTHARAGELLASRYQAGREEPPAEIANHLELGGQQPAAAAYWLRAGRVALAAFDAPAAVAAFTRTLDLERTPGDVPASAASVARRREALAGREDAYRQLGEHERQAADLRELEVLCIGDAARLADVKNRAAVRHLRLGDYGAAVAASEEAEESAALGRDEAGEANALRIRAEAYERQGHYDQALDIIRRAVEIFGRIGDFEGETKAMIGAGRIHLVRAHYEEARDAYKPIIERVRQSGDPWLERVVRNHVAVIHMCLGNFESAIRSARRSVDICRRYGDRAREGDNLSVCGIILLEVGRYDEAREHFQRALSILGGTGSRWSRADCLVYAGATEGHLRNWTAALDHLEESMTTAREIGARYIEANALVAMATVLLQRAEPGDVERACDAARDAAETARNATLVGPEIQGLSRQAEATWIAGDVDSALELSARAVALLDEHRYVEGSEEDILYTHYEVLRAAGSDEADAMRERARQGVMRKLSGLTDPDWRRSFTEDVALHAELMKPKGAS